MGERVTMVLADGTKAKLVELAGGERSQGEFVSRLVQSTWEAEQAGGPGQADFEGLRLMVLGLSARLRTLEAQLQRVEQRTV